MRIVVIGIGSFGRNHVRDLKELGHEVITCDIDKRFNSNFLDYKMLDFGNIDGAIVATPASTHYEIAKYLLEKRCPTLVEKPMTMNYEQAIELVEIADIGKITFAVGHIFRYNAVTKRLIIELRRIVQEEEQDILAIRSQRIGLHSPRTDCGVVWDYATHDIDLVGYILYSIFGCDNTYDRKYKYIMYDHEHVVKGYPLGTKNEDIASLSYSINGIFTNGIFTQIDVDWINPVKNRTLTFICSNETVEADFVDEELRIHKSGLFPISKEEGESRFNTKMGDTIIPKITHEEPLKKELEDFIYCIKNGTEPISNARSCLSAIKFIGTL